MHYLFKFVVFISRWIGLDEKFKWRIGFTGYVYDFSADYNAIEVDNIKDNHKHLIEKNGIVWISKV